MSLESLPFLHQQLLLRNETSVVYMSSSSVAWQYSLFMFKEQCNENGHISLSTTQKPKGKSKASTVNRKLDVSWKGILFELFFIEQREYEEKYRENCTLCLAVGFNALIASNAQWSRHRKKLIDSSQYKISIISPCFSEHVRQLR